MFFLLHFFFQNWFIRAFLDMLYKYFLKSELLAICITIPHNRRFVVKMFDIQQPARICWTLRMINKYIA